MHYKRLNLPKTHPKTRKKGIVFITRPAPGPHKLKECISLNFVIKDFLKYTKTTKETKKLLNAGKILVDNKIRKDNKFPIGFMDIISIPTLNEDYRVVYDQKGKLDLIKIKKEEAKNKACKIINKTILKKGKLQLNLYDGKNILVTKDNYKAGDTIIIQDNKIIKHIKFEKNAFVFLTAGKHIGTTGTIEEIKKAPGSTKDTIVIKQDSTKIETLKDYAFIIDKSMIK